MSGYVNPPRPSRWLYDKFKDDVHFYILLGAIPVGIFIVSMNVFIGPAKLEVIPEGYKPQEWEYYRNPTVRFLVKHFKRGHQQDYETTLHNIWEAEKIAEMRALKKEVRRQMQIHGDYKGWYHRQDVASYARRARVGQEFNTSTQGYKFYEGAKVE